MACKLLVLIHRYESDLSIIPNRIKTGKFLTQNDAQEIVIGKSLAHNLKVIVGDELTLLGSGYDGSIATSVLTIVGIFDSGMPDINRGVVEIPFNTFQDIFSMEQFAHVLVGTVDNLNNLENVLTQIHKKIVTTYVG
ncbi:MAG: ABC transporter permease, partial [Bacteroidales bacterium]|nr:ABC transporter permease [Bacteroidales bacterium]